MESDGQVPDDALIPEDERVAVVRSWLHLRKLRFEPPPCLCCRNQASFEQGVSALCVNDESSAGELDSQSMSS